MGVYGYPWISIDFHGYPWLSMGIGFEGLGGGPLDLRLKIVAFPGGLASVALMAIVCKTELMLALCACGFLGGKSPAPELSQSLY